MSPQSGHVFRIDLLNPSQAYFAGQIIQGRVYLHVGSEKKTGGIKLKCTGKADVHFTEQHSVTRGTGQNRTTHSETRHYRATEHYFEFKLYLLGGSNMPEQMLPAGTYDYPFQFQIPTTAPSSFQGRHGHIQYSLEATVKRSWNFDYNTVLPFTVNSLVDLNTWPRITDPLQMQKEKYLCCLCCQSGPICMTFRMDRTGFVPGQPLDFIMEVDNKSTTSLTRMRIKLNQNIHFNAQGHSKSTSTSVMQLTGPHIAAGESEVWRGTTKIPPLPPSGLGGCNIIKLSYSLQPEIDIPGGFNLKGQFEIIIGTIPLRAQFNRLQPIQPAPLPFFEPTGSDVVPSAPPDAGFPSAPPLINDYPDLPPPSYELATKYDDNLPDYDQAKDNEEDGGRASGATAFDPNFVPKYPTYGWVEH